MVMLELISGEAPFIARKYDLHLALNICKGERPLIPGYTPEIYAASIKRCWDSIPANRPTAKELHDQIFDWKYVISGSSYETFGKNCRIAMKKEIKKAFNREREDKLKARQIHVP
jgi:hypothetical protein